MPLARRPAGSALRHARPDGTARQFVARDTLKGGTLHPTYDDLSIGTGVVLAPSGPQVAGMGMGSKRSQSVDVIGATSESGRRRRECGDNQCPARTPVRNDSVRAMAQSKSQGSHRLYFRSRTSPAHRHPPSSMSSSICQVRQLTNRAIVRIPLPLRLDKASAPDGTTPEPGLILDRYHGTCSRLSEAGDSVLRASQCQSFRLAAPRRIGR